MKMKMRIGYLIAAVLMSSAAHAADSGYADLGYAPLKFSGGGASLTPGVALLHVGYNITDYFSVEALAATTVKSAADGFGGELKVDSLFGGYLKARAELNKYFEVFGKAGVARTAISVTGGGSAHDSDFSYGIGARCHFAKSVYAQLEYDSYYDKDGLRIAGPSLSVGVRF
jgi:hypothetical protein